MEERIIDLSEEAAGLSVRLGQLLIRRETEEQTVPLEDLAALVVSHPAVHYTHAVLAGVCTNGGTVILCNEKRLPVGMLLPLTSHFVQAERMSSQLEVALPAKKRLWKQIVQAKIKAQARLLLHFSGNDGGLEQMTRRVRSGDPRNLEGQASRRYWPILFGSQFRRIPGGNDPINCLLNYGYAVLRGVVARAICAVGLHPTVGLHHHNRYNPFCLADDIMEPYRPFVDTLARGLVTQYGTNVPLDRTSKSRLIQPMLSQRLILNRERRSLFDVVARTASSLVQVFQGDRKRLLIPDIPFEDLQTCDQAEKEQEEDGF